MKKIIKTLLLSSLVIGMATGCDFGGKSKPESSSSESGSSESSLVSSSSSEQQSSSNDTSSKESSSSTLSSSNSSSSASSAASSSQTSSSAQSSSSAVSSSSSSSSSASSSSSSSSSSSVAPILMDISLNTDNVKKNYEQGERLNLTGLVVTASYDNGSTAVIPEGEYTTDPANNSVLDETGSKSITVTYQNVSKTFDIVVSKKVKTDWTTAEAKIMSDNLQGIVLPYTGYEESVVTYNTTYEVVYINGGDSKNHLAEYGNKLTGDGFTVSIIGADTYSFSKKVNTSKGETSIKGTFYNDDNDQFYLEAYDAYYNNFPAAIAAEFAADYYSTEVLPAFPADRYQVDQQDCAIFCYTSSTTAEADYSSILRNAAWNVSDTADSNGFFTAVAPGETYMVYYRYDSVQYHSLDIYMTPINYWNDKPINNFYSTYTDYSVNIPLLNVEGAHYLFVESEINEAAYESGNIELVHSFYFIYGAKKADLTRYVEILQGFNWEVTGSNNLYKALFEREDKGLVRIEVEYSSTYGAVIITFYAKLEPFPVAGWPYDGIAEILTEDVTDVLPAYEGENQGFNLMNDYFGSYVQVLVSKGAEQDAIAAYQATLEANGYRKNGEYIGSDPVYVSPNGQIWVNVYYGTSGSFSIDFKMMPNIWPGASIAQALKDLFGNITEKVPAYNNAEEYNLDKGEGVLYIEITLQDGASLDSALAEYVNILKANEFTETGEDGDGDMHYGSKLGQLDICPYISGGMLILYVTSLMTPEVGWPTSTINGYMSSMSFTDPLPAYEGSYTNITAEVAQYVLTIVITLPEDSDAEGEYDGYRYLLKASYGFSLSEELPFGFGFEYLSPNSQYTVVVSQLDNGIQLTIEEAEKDTVNTDGFPMDVVIQYFPQAQGVLPSANFGDVEYSVDGYEGSVCIYVEFATEAEAAAGVESYTDALKTAGFVGEYVWGSDEYIAYMAPDGTYGVMVDYYENELSITLYDSTYF